MALCRAPSLRDGGSGNGATSASIQRKLVTIPFVFVLSGVTVVYQNSLPVISVRLPSRRERCQFTLKPLSDSVGVFLQQLQAEDRGIDRVAVYSTGTTTHQSSHRLYLFTTEYEPVWNRSAVLILAYKNALTADHQEVIAHLWHITAHNVCPFRLAMSFFSIHGVQEVHVGGGVMTVKGVRWDIGYSLTCTKGSYTILLYGIVFDCTVSHDIALLHYMTQIVSQFKN